MKYFYRWEEEEKADLGSEYSTAEGSFIQGERIQIALVHKTKGTGSNAHRHPNEQFNWVIKGTLKAMVEGQEQIVTKGGVIYIPANAVHYTIATPEEDVTFLAVKDMSWGIKGIPIDPSAGAYRGPDSKKK